VQSTDPPYSVPDVDYVENVFADKYAVDSGIHAERSADGKVVYLQSNDADSWTSVNYATLQQQVATLSWAKWGENLEWLSLWLGIFIPAVALCIVVLVIQTGDEPERQLPDRRWIYAAVGIFSTCRVLGAVLKYMAATSDAGVRNWLVEIYASFVTALLDHLRATGQVHKYVPRIDMRDLNFFRVFEFLVGLCLVVPAAYTVAHDNAGWGFGLWFAAAILTHDAIVATADNKRRFIQVFYLYILDAMEHFIAVHPELSGTAGYERAKLEIALVRAHIPEVYRAHRKQIFGAQDIHLHTFAVEQLRAKTIEQP
jgi:hypothetical protein